MTLEMKKREAMKLEEAGDAKLQGNTGIRIKEGTIKRQEELARKDLVEWGMTLLNRSTEDLVGDKEIINGDTMGKLLLINGLTPDILSQGILIQSVEAYCEKTLQVLRVALERRDLVVMLTCEEHAYQRILPDVLEFPPLLACVLLSTLPAFASFLVLTGSAAAPASSSLCIAPLPFPFCTPAILSAPAFLLLLPTLVFAFAILPIPLPWPMPSGPSPAASLILLLFVSVPSACSFHIPP